MDSGESPAFGPLLRKLRLSRGLSQEALADLARISAEAVGALERGSRKAPQRQTLSLLIDALELGSSDRELLEAAAVKPSTPRRRSERGEIPPPAFVERRNLPRLLTPFVGRESEVHALQQLVAQRRLVTLTGPGGVGKTRTAIEIATAIVKNYPDGAWLVDLAPLRDATLVAQAVSTVLQIREVSERSLLATIVTAVRHKTLLLVFDNCEHVLHEAAQVVQTLLNECSGLTVIATSRQPLRISGESVFRLPPLLFPEETSTLDAEAALDFAAVKLFVQCAVAADPSFAITDKNAGTIASICRHIDGIPFAIELAASKVAALSVAQIAEYLKYRFTLLSDGASTALPRQQTLRALIDWSYDLLLPDEQSFLARLSIFRGSFSAEAAASVCLEASAQENDALHLLIALVEKSLVVSEFASDGEKRFRLLETTRAYSTERLAETGSYDAIAQRNAFYVLMFARRVRTTFDPADTQAWLDAVSPEIENIRSVLSWSLSDEHDVPLGAEVAARFGPFWEARSYVEGKRWLASARALIDRLDPSLAASVILESVRRFPLAEEAIELSQSAIEAYRGADDAEGLYHSLEYGALTLINAGRYEEASAIIREAEAISSARIDAVSAAHLATISGFAKLYRHKLDEAFADLVRAESLLPKEPHPREKALILRCFGETALAKNDVPAAIELFSQALRESEGCNSTRMRADAHYQLAHALLLANRLEEAQPLAFSAVEDLTEDRVAASFLEALTVCAAICQRLGHLEQAARLLGFVDSRMASFPYRFAFLVEELRTGTRNALQASMDILAYSECIQRGARLDEIGVLEEICYRSREPNKI